MTRAGGAAVLLLAFALLSACGAADSTETRRGEPRTIVSLSVRECPSFTNHLIFPGELEPGQAAFVYAIAEEPKKPGNSDPLPPLAYSWEATSGALSSPTQPFTDYHCGEAGDQRLTATVENPSGCKVRLSLPVTCLEQ